MENRIEYAYRLETRRIKEDTFPYSNQTLSSPGDVVNFTRTLENSDIEKFLVLYLNTKNRLICIQVTQGTIDHNAVYPREVIKHALLASAASILLVHNHPSGIPDPSPEDKNLTASIKAACTLLDIRLLDHVIIGEEGKHFSFQEARIL